MKEIGSVTHFSWVIALPYLEREEHQVFRYVCRVKRVSAHTWDYSFKERGGAFGEGRVSHITHYYVAQHKVVERCIQNALLHNLDWQDMDYEKTAPPVIPVHELSTALMTE